MRRKKTLHLVALAAPWLLAAAALGAEQDPWERFGGTVADFLSLLGTGRYAEAHALLDPRYGETLTPQKLAGAMDPIRAEVGDFRKIVEHREKRLPGGGPERTRFVVTCAHENPEKVVKLLVGVDRGSRIAEVALDRIEPAPRPESAGVKHAGYVPRTLLRLPFRGEWVVEVAGRSAEENPHFADPRVRFGIDFAWPGTVDPANPASRPDVLAPADGAVARIVPAAGTPPGGAPPLPPCLQGTMVVLEHAKGEFTWLGPLDPATLAVQEGKPVACGAPIGKLSPLPAGPRLHMHLADRATLEGVESLPMVFSGIRVNGEVPALGDAPEPALGERVENSK